MTRVVYEVLLAAAVCLAAASCSCSTGNEHVLEVAPELHEQAADGRTFDHEHRLWTRLLARHVRDDRLDYAALKAEVVELDRYLASLQRVGPEKLARWSRERRFAFWINVYNAHTVKLVVEAYPVASIRDLGGAVLGRVFDRAIIPMPAHHPGAPDENYLSLNDVEHRILRARFEDARVHAAINCASESCPALLPEAFVGAHLDAQLERAMSDFVNDPRRNRFEAPAGGQPGRLHLSRVFEWFGEDFERDAGSLRAYVARYSDGDTDWVESARLGFLDYSWKLNDVVGD